jgi:DNA-damage-inducible protein J
MAATTMVHIRVDETLKTQATDTLAAMGLSLSDAVRVFLTRVVAEQRLPFALKAPNAENARRDGRSRPRSSSTRNAPALADAPRRCSMPSTKKPARARRAAPPRRVDYAKAFLKDWERLSRSGRYDLEAVEGSHAVADCR